MVVLLASEVDAAPGQRIQGRYGQTEACKTCPLARLCTRRRGTAFAIVQAVRPAAWLPCPVFGRVRAVDAVIYDVEDRAPRPAPRRLTVVLDTCALDHPAIRDAVAQARHDFLVPHEVAIELGRAPFRDALAWDGLRLVTAEPRDPCVVDVAPSEKLDAPSRADRAVLQAALDQRADIIVSADRHVTGAALPARAAQLGFRLRVMRPDEFVRAFLAGPTGAAA